MTTETQAALRERIAEALRTTPATGHAHEPGQERFDHHPKPGERGHRYTYTCALCRNDVDALADALLPVVAELVADRDRLAAEVDRLTDLVARYADRGIANGQRAERAEAKVARALELLKQVPHEVLPGVPGHDHLSVRQAIAALDGTGEA